MKFKSKNQMLESLTYDRFYIDYKLDSYRIFTIKYANHSIEKIVRTKKSITVFSDGWNNSFHDARYNSYIIVGIKGRKRSLKRLNILLKDALKVSDLKKRDACVLKLQARYKVRSE